MIKALFLTLALGLVAPSNAQESYAENLLREKIWEGYTEGFAVRTATTAELNLSVLKAGEDLPREIDDLIDRIEADSLTGDKLVFELDQLRAAVIPEISYEADWTLPMLQAGAWLEGAHLVSQALGDDPNGAGTALLKQPEVVDYFLRYVQQEGDGRAESAVLDTLKATLGKIKEICSQDAMTADDIKAIHESTGVVLDLLLKRG